MTNPNPNISFRVTPEFQKIIDTKAEELNIPRSVFLRNLVYNILHYPVSDNAYRTLTVGKLREILEPLPEDLPLTAYDDDGNDYALSELSLYCLLAGLKLDKLNKPISKTEWSLEEICKPKKEETEDED